MKPWLQSASSAGHPPARVVCFAHAGGNARNFVAWQPELLGDAELIAVQPPHPPDARLPLADYISGAATAVAGLAEADQRPIYLFGHSLGALVAFEVSRRLRHVPVLAQLVVSALAAPVLLPSARVQQLARLDGPEFATELAFFGGMPPEVLAEPELQEVLLPGVRADFVLAAEYRYRADSPLSIPVNVITGVDDPHIGPAQVEPWRDECEAGLTTRWVPGGHFYFQDNPALITDLLRDLVRSDQHVELI